MLRRIGGELRALFRRRRADAELDEELEFHLEMEAQRHVQVGVPAAEARRRARVAFGGVEQYRERAMSERAAQRLEDVWRDVRQGARGLLRAPAHALITVLTLGLGTGAATAMFSIVDGVLLRPLPYPESDRLFTLYEAREAGGIRVPSYPSFEDWRERLTAFESVAFIRGDEFRLRGDDGTQRLVAGYVSTDFFAMIGTQPLLGRVFDAEREETNVVVLSHEVWQRRFGGDPSVLGRSAATADGTFTVIGVMPPGVRVPAWGVDVFAPLDALPPDARFALTRRDARVDAEVWGRTRGGVTPEQAQEDVARVVAELAASYPDAAGEFTTAALTPVRERTLGDIASQLRVLAAAVGLLLLIVCVNVAGLQLARGSARVRELAVRSALGAGRGRLMRQLLTESLLLALCGGVIGVILAIAAVQGLAGSGIAALPRVDEIGVDVRTFGFALAVSTLAAIGFGTLPALRASRPGLSPALREGSSGAGTSMRSSRLRAGLVVTQVALAVTLTVGSGLLLRSLWALQQIELGFTPDNVLTLRVFPPATYDDPDAAAELYRRLQASVQRVRGVDEVALANHAPVAGGWMVTRLVTGFPPPPTSENALIRTVSPEYFGVMGARLLSGRLLEPADVAGVGTGLVINDAASRQFFGGVDPVGRSVTIFRSAHGRTDFGEPIQATVVGVVAGERFFGPESDAPPAVFVPYTWMVWPNITLLARTRGETTALLPALRQAVQQIDQDIPVAGPARQAEWRPLGDYAAGALEQRRMMAVLIAAFAASSLALAILGIFGVTAWFVARRSREIGVRVALGAAPIRVAGLVLRHALLLAALGIAVGLPAAMAATRLVQHQLFGISAADPSTLVTAAFIFVAAAVAAASVPAWRALRISPARTLRAD